MGQIALRLAALLLMGELTSTCNTRDQAGFEASIDHTDATMGPPDATQRALDEQADAGANIEDAAEAAPLSVPHAPICTELGDASIEVTLEGTLWSEHNCYLDLDHDRCFAFSGEDGALERWTHKSIVILGGDGSSRNGCVGLPANTRDQRFYAQNVPLYTRDQVPRVRIRGRLSVTTILRDRTFVRWVAISPSNISAPDAGLGTLPTLPPLGNVSIGPISTALRPVTAGGAPTEPEPRIRGLGAQFRSCYEKFLVKDPSMEGNIVIAIKVDEHGAVQDVSKTGGTGLSSDVEQCVVSVPRRMTVDASGYESTIQVPLTFKRR
jgi:hypothetical protein